MLSCLPPAHQHNSTTTTHTSTTTQDPTTSSRRAASRGTMCCVSHGALPQMMLLQTQIPVQTNERVVETTISLTKARVRERTNGSIHPPVRVCSRNGSLVSLPFTCLTWLQSHHRCDIVLCGVCCTGAYRCTVFVHSTTNNGIR